MNITMNRQLTTVRFDARIFALMALIILSSLLPSRTISFQSAVNVMPEVMSKVFSRPVPKYADPAPDSEKSKRFKPFATAASFGAGDNAPARIEIPAKGIDSAIVKSSYDNTVKGSVNWSGDVYARERHNLVLWGYDIGWSNPSDMPLANLQTPVSYGTLLILTDESGNQLKYKLNWIFWTAKTDMEVLDLGDKEMITVIASAGEKEFDGNTLTGTTHRRIFVFIPADLYDHPAAAANTKTKTKAKANTSAMDSYSTPAHEADTMLELVLNSKLDY